MPCVLGPSAVAHGLLVGVSGGIDSVVLLHALARIWRNFALTTPLLVAHVNYQLRRTARADEAFVARLAAQHALPLVSLRVPTREHPHSGNLQAWAREMRYQFFAQAATARGITQLAVAHTASDQAETLLLHLLRGAGLDGLAGMRPSRALTERLTLVRPLLGATREEVQAYARAHRVRHRNDPTNRSQQFLRNRIRHTLVPVLEQLAPHAVRHLAECATIVAQDVEWITAHVPSVLRSLAPRMCQPGMSVDRAILRGLPSGVRHRIYRHIAAKFGTRALAYRHAVACDHVLAEGRMYCLPGPLAFDARAARVRIWPGVLPTDRR